MPFAKVLATSFLQHHPQAKFYLLLVDGDADKPAVDLGRNIEVITPSRLDLDSEIFFRMSIYYDVTELSTALKPYALKYLLDEGSDIAIYLDPDIQVFSELTEVILNLSEAPIALTPHTLKPIPDDGLRPNYNDIMSSGTFNLGFIAIKSCDESRRFLKWWGSRLVYDSIVDISNNLFTDQRWIDFVPSYFNFSIIRDSGYNVAYWNLHERVLEKTDEGITVNGQPLRFLHFSGYRPDKPWILSKYVADKPRVTISQQPVFKVLATNYGSEAQGFGWQSEASIEYGYAKLNKYVKITPSLRRRYRDQVLNAVKGRGKFPPLPTDSIVSINSWIDSRSAESGRLSGALFEVWKARPDLQATFPRASTLDAERFVNWAYTHGLGEGAINENEIKLFDDIVEESKNSESFTIINEVGVNVSGYFKGEFGVGQSGRLIARAAFASGLPVSVIGNHKTESRQNEDFDDSPSDVYYPVTIGVVNADQFPNWIADLPAEIRSKSKFIGVWAWEVDDFPKRFFSAFDLVDEIWAVSEFVKNSIQPHTKKPVYVVPTPVVSPEISESLNYASVGLIDGDQFNLFIFDYMSVFRRKNPTDLVTVHKNAFPNCDGPKLVIKTINANLHPTQHEKLIHMASDRDDIIILDKYLSRDQLHSLVNECQAYISLHRSEGYGLTLAEAMSLGKPVISTAYSGNLDFMNDRNSILVPFDLVDVGTDAYPYGEKAKWAQPNLEFAAEAMRKLYLQPELRSHLGSQAKMDLSSEFSIERAANFVKHRVEGVYFKGRGKKRMWVNRGSL
jgi:glycosyltransferase involved in cell wall biosynthesis